MNAFTWLIVVILCLMLLAMCDIRGAGGKIAPVDVAHHRHGGDRDHHLAVLARDQRAAGSG